MFFLFDLIKSLDLIISSMERVHVLSSRYETLEPIGIDDLLLIVIIPALITPVDRKKKIHMEKIICLILFFSGGSPLHPHFFY